MSNGGTAGDGIHLTAAELIALRPRCHALRLPMRHIPPARGDTHLRQCLEALALHGHG